MSAYQMETLHVPLFVIGGNKEGAKKVLEEAAEVFGAWQTYEDSLGTFLDVDGGNPCRDRLSYEIYDCIQACVNLAARYGLDLKRAAREVTESNVRRGRLFPGVVRHAAAQTNYDRWFGSPQKAAHAISRLTDYLESLSEHEGESWEDDEPEVYHSDFTDALRKESPLALIHQDTLLGWLTTKAGAPHAEE